MTAVGPLTTPPRAPTHLSDDAKAVWTPTAKYLVDRGLLHSADLPSLENYCDGVVRRRRLQAAIDNVDLSTYADPEAFKVTEKLLVQLNQVSGLVSRLGSALMLNPGSRSKANASVRKDAGSASEEADWGKALRRVK
jgi:P27 family predicted phage terminase small subunit